METWEMDYTIDQSGPDGSWRVTWLRPDGFRVEKFFRSEESAENWVELISALASDRKDDTGFFELRTALLLGNSEN